jgi:DNA-binding GntR family transcriptional regulator
MTTADELPPWDTEWAAQKAAEALRYLGRNFPECLEKLRVASLDEHETAVGEAAIRGGDEDAYLKALRAYMRAGRDEALRIRRGAA